MHPGKIRTGNIPFFQLTPRDAVFLICLTSLAAYVVGFVTGFVF